MAVLLLVGLTWLLANTLFGGEGGSSVRYFFSGKGEKDFWMLPLLEWHISSDGAFMVFVQVPAWSQHRVSQRNFMVEPFDDDWSCRMAVSMYHPPFLHRIPQQKCALGSINVASQLPALQSIWPSAWCLVPPMSLGLKSASRTRCETCFLLLCPLPSAVSFSHSFLFLIPIDYKPAL